MLMLPLHVASVDRNRVSTIVYIVTHIDSADGNRVRVNTPAPDMTGAAS